ncbi:MAG: acetoacetate decarboxylase family protein [Anaerolineae bacterium]|jgi:hypothetical protein|nr:acetoacetate decarboxylase family protein [Anaerolineae bacterium]
MTTIETLAPAPWTLTGNGYILLYRWPRSFASAHSPFGLSKGGFGAVMLVDYQTTPVGPYHEILFIPGQVAYTSAIGYSISKIYVSTMDSVINGQLNWGIPKEQAQFDWQTSTDGQDQIRVSIDQHPIASVDLTPFGPRFPVSSAILPPIVQHRDHQTLITRLQSQGQGQLAKLDRFWVDDQGFPTVNQFRPLVVVKIHDFKMTFPIPKRV